MKLPLLVPRLILFYRGAAVQSGDHIVWHCNLHQSERQRNRMVGLEGPEGWKEVDRPI